MFKKLSLIGVGLLLSATYTSKSLSSDFFDYEEPIKEEVVSITKYSQKDINCLAKNIYYEARNESFEGKVAVAQVTINRTNSPKYPAGICEVVYQKTKKDGVTICQFSWTCLKQYAKMDEYMWEEAKFIAHKVLTDGYSHAKLAKSNALYFHSKYINPGWNRKYIIAQIGNHIFYGRI
jgi:spore germination cell wall hydrolase CwlJ-like protein